MVVTQPDYFESFSCIAGDCPDSCCIGWQVIPDKEHLDFYENLPGELGEEIRRGIVDVDGEPSFSLCNGRCCMLREDGLCKIQYALGEEALSKVCGFYPRFVTELGLIREQGVSVSCPEVARMILTREEPISFKTYTTNDPLRYFHDVEPERLLTIRQGRDKGIKILQNRQLPLAHRMKQLLSIGIEVDEVEFTPPTTALSDKNYDTFRKSLYELFLSLEHLRPDWTAMLKKGSVESNSLTAMDESPCWEHLLVYFLFKYALRSSMDDNFLESISMAILSVFLLQDIFSHASVDLIHLVQLYAKETEHNEDNLSILMNAIWDEPAFSLSSIAELLNRFC